MKWFKHLSNARDDERISDLEDAAGLEGYGFYFKLLEIVAATMDGSDRCEVGFSISRWATLTNCHPIKARTLLGRVGSCGLVELRLDGDRAVVRIPKLLKHRDNHTKNLQVTCKQEVEKEKEEEKEKATSTKGRASRLPRDWVLPHEWRVWALAEKPEWGESGVLATAENFRDYWLGAPKGTKVDWEATWRKWVRSSDAPKSSKPSALPRYT